MISIPLIQYIVLMTTAATISTYGSFVTLPFKHLDQWSAIKMALPYAWVDWIFLTIAISIGKEHELASPLQMKFSLTIFKFLLVLLFTKYYLKEEISLSDIIGFSIVILAYICNLMGVVSKYLYGKDKPPSPKADTPVVTTNKDTPKKDETVPLHNPE